MAKNQQNLSKIKSNVSGGSSKMAETIDELNSLLERAGSAEVNNEDYWRTVRAQFPYQGKNLYTNNGTIGIQPHMVLQSQIATLKQAEIQEEGFSGVGYPNSAEAHKKLAALINADTSEIAITRNSTESMNTIALGLDLKPEDEILTTTHEHYGGWSCWQNRHALLGNQIRKLDLYDPPEEEDEIVGLFEKAIRPETRVLSFCHVTCTTAWRLPVRKICAMARQRGIITVIDGAQSVGMIAVDVKDLACDFYVSSTHKWLFTPKGTGLLYVDANAQQKISLGYHTTEEPLSARRFENNASQSSAPLVGFAVAVDFHNAIGTALIEDRGSSMAEWLKNRLSDIPGVRVWTPNDRTLSASMVSFSIAGMTSSDVGTPLRERYHIESRGLHEGGYHGARISCAMHNNYDEMEKVVRAVTEIAANRC
tara:strand:+ start:130 stop:1398 length:1269 start_codon:yes stop_codon:yes gene_type:complete